MKAADIKVGGRYTAKVNGQLVTVRVDTIRRDHSPQWYDVTNERTGRKTTFRSAGKFRQEVKTDRDGFEYTTVTPEQTARIEAELAAEAEQRPDPTPNGSGTSSDESQRGRALTGHTSPTSSPAAAAAPAAERPTERVPRASINARLAEAMAARDAREPDTAPHLIVRARAGTGKTTTMIEGLKVLRGIEPRIVPSPQQRAVWDSLMLSAGKAQTVGFVAFNKSIATELQARVPAGVDAMTMHSLGNRAVTAAFGRVQLNEYRVRDLIAELTGRDGRELMRNDPTLVKATEDLVGLCKMNLTDLSLNPIQMLGELADHYDVELNGCRQKVFDLVPRVLDRCRDVARDKVMDFDDMIWLPIALNLPVRRYDLLLVDEAQDLNRCQQALAKRAGNRLVLVGDDRQAIYGFAGADSESLDRMVRELRGDKDCPQEDYHGNEYGTVTERGSGCIILPLTVTRRCGKSIVAEARRYVPDFEAHEDNPEGVIEHERYPGKRKSMGGTEEKVVPWEEGYGPKVRDGDFILCRTNAPLVSQCFAFIRRGVKANIQGRDVGAGLKSTVKKMEGKESSLPIPEFVRRLSDWLAAETAKEQAKRNPSENRLTGLTDRYECLMAFAEGCGRTSDLLARIDSVFTDDKTVRGVRLSSIHRAKGLEARRVFYLKPPGTGPREDKMKEWELHQEDNLRYVAVTRAIEELVYVS